MRRILYVIPDLDLGGAERHLVYLASSLPKDEFKTMIFVMNGNGALKDIASDMGVKIYSPWFSKNIGGLPRPLRQFCFMFISSLYFVKILILERPTIVHAFLPAAYLLVGIVTFFFKVPIRVMSRRSLNYYQKRHPIAARLEWFLHAHMSLILGNSKRVVEELISEGADAEKVSLLYNGVPDPGVSCALQRSDTFSQLGVGEKSFVMVITANLFFYKGHADLIKACSMMKDNLGSDWALLCIGRDRGILHELKSLAEYYGVSDNIHWLGSRTDISAILKVSDVGILSSHEEGFSNALLEYMAYSLPVIATDVGGNSEAVVDTVTGFIVPSRSPEDLCRAIEYLYLNSEKRRQMGIEGRKRFETTFTLNLCVDNYLNKYRTLCRNVDR